MAFDDFYHNYAQLLFSKYPSVKSREADLNLKLENLVSPFKVSIPSSIYQKVDQAIKAMYALSHRRSFLKSISVPDNHKAYLDLSASPKSLLMAYDFHVDINNETAALIEVNTNASGYLISQLLYELENSPCAVESERNLKSSFEEETRSLNKNFYTVLMDEDILLQNMYFEFLMYSDLLLSWGWDNEISNFKDLILSSNEKALMSPKGQRVDFIYNRFCDFTFDRLESKPLKESYLQKWARFSPHPKEYLLLASKERLIELSSTPWLDQQDLTSAETDAINSILIPTFSLSSFETPEALWKERKQFFFKPKSSFGGKSAYRGSSITKKTFKRVLNEDTLLQKYVPAPKVTLPSINGADWKYDLRFYVYGDEIQMTAARIYQGQVTNLSTPHGGFTKVEFV